MSAAPVVETVEIVEVGWNDLIADRPIVPPDELGFEDIWAKQKRLIYFNSLNAIARIIIMPLAIN